ncbi:hypothetical protein ACJDU8_19605 [Clostridium sp. WILCCON 0269]|uniref:Uncharacterized protein n=1 Tax=Candidatus Clostridium eludens TaxID=3381663 RepID=A0ABW8SNV3_9CLOT
MLNSIINITNQYLNKLLFLGETARDGKLFRFKIKRDTSIRIEEIDGAKLDRLSPIERKGLEKEVEEWKGRAEKALAKINMISMGAIYNQEMG